jgi:CubicO group peptidase (beta-lactamase class C family)
MERTTLDNLYDVASVTKVASTTLMVMKAADRDTHLLNATLREYIEDLDTAPSRLSDIRIEDLLIHQSGLAPAPPVYPLMKIIDSVGLRDIVYSRRADSTHQVQISENLWLNEVWLDSLWQWCRNRSVPGPRGNYLYSDYNFFMLMKVLEEKYGHRLDSLVNDSIYTPLGLHHTTYLPLHRFTLEQIAPTELDRWWRRELVHGFVHDQTAAVTAGVGGNAGLFSNAHDLAVIMQMLLNHGSYGGTQIYSPATVTRFTSRSPYCYRGLGWDMQTGSATYTMVCQSASPACFGHIGFTGTCIWADPTHDIVFVFLSNRVHPSSKNYKINEHRIRQSLQQVVYESLGLYPPDPECEHASFMESNVERDSVK